MKRLSPRSAAQTAGAMALAALTFLYRFPPETYTYPACPIYSWFHVLCPGCGSTRALSALLHLEWSEAMAWNPMFPGMFLAGSAWALMQYASATWKNRFVGIEPSASSYWAASGAAAVFTIARNLS